MQENYWIYLIGGVLISHFVWLLLSMFVQFILERVSKKRINIFKTSISLTLITILTFSLVEFI